MACPVGPGDERASGATPLPLSPYSTAWRPGPQSPRSHRGLGPGLVRCPEPVALDRPLPVVPPPELPQGLDQVRHRGEGPGPEQVLLQRADGALRHPVAFRFPDEARRAGHAQERQLLLEVIAHVGTSVVVADGQTRDDPLLEAAELLAHPLA